MVTRLLASYAAQMTDRTIDVQFIDEATGATFARSAVPAERLPESFEADTTFHLGGEDWQVVSAVPMTREEYTASGSLVLSLRQLRIEMLSPESILFSLPTIASALPAVDGSSSKLGRRVLDLHEDDWCQMEVIDGAMLSLVLDELGAIARVQREERSGPGFKSIHPRKAIREPLASSRLLLGELP
ncbi:MAG: hypothetical protein QM765_35775 [Myxococcales bacterium]